jgi:DNA topoisomerase I
MNITRTFENNEFVFKKRSKKINDLNTLTRIKSLKIPPAYTDVKISNNPSSKIQATGLDTKKRKQYMYHKNYTKKQSKIKFNELIIFGKKIKRIRKDINNNIFKCSKNSELLKTKECIISIILYLIDNCNFRVGCEKYKKLYNTYGVTTLNKSHFKFNKKSVYIHFVGKKGVINKTNITNSNICSILKILCHTNKDFLFYYNDKGKSYRINEKHINMFLKKYDKNITVKMFRTWNSNYILLKELLNYSIPKTEKEAKQNIKLSIKKAAAKLHHSSIVSKKSYLNNEIVTMYLNDITQFKKIIEYFRKTNGNLPSINRLLNLILKMLN